MRLDAVTENEEGEKLTRITEADEFYLVLDKIRRNKGLDFSLYRAGTIKRRLQARIRATGCTGYSDYIVYLNREPSEYDRVLDSLAINVTEFFRDPTTFRILQEDVIPEIVRSKQAEGRKIIRAWSAGASNGEEAYSLAILFLEVLRERIAYSGQRTEESLNAGRSTLNAENDFHIKVYGTDIDTDSLAKAKAGIYPPTSLRHVPPEFLQRYFHKEGENYAVTREVKPLVRFQRHDLVSDRFLDHMDLILCRNVVIYFTRPLQDFVYSSFSRALNAGGFFVLGKVESLWGYPAAHFETVNLAERIYQKKG